MCDGENLEGNFSDRHTMRREKYLEGNLPRQTLNDICCLDDGSSPRTYSQKLGWAHKNQPASLLQLTFMYKKVFYLSGGVFACDKGDWAEEDFFCVVSVLVKYKGKTNVARNLIF